MKKTIIFMILMVLAAAFAAADEAQDVADALYRYHKYEMQEDIVSFVNMMDYSFLEESDQSDYKKGVKNINLALFDYYDTESFEISGADVFVSGDDAKVFYQLKSELTTSDKETVSIDNAYAAVLHNTDKGWKITYVMPRLAYEQRRLVKSYVETELGNDYEYVGDLEREQVMEKRKGLFSMLFEMIAKIFERKPAADRPQDDTADKEVIDDKADDKGDDSPEPVKYQYKETSCLGMQERWIHLASEAYEDGMALEDISSYKDEMQELNDNILGKSECKRVGKDQAITFLSCRSRWTMVISTLEGKGFAFNSRMDPDSAVRRALVELDSCIQTNAKSSPANVRVELVPYGCWHLFHDHVVAQDRLTNAINTAGEDHSDEELIASKAEEAMLECSLAMSSSSACSSQFDAANEAYEIYKQNEAEGMIRDMLVVYKDKYLKAYNDYKSCYYKNPPELEEDNRLGCEEAYYKYMLTVRANQRAQAESTNDEYKQDMKENMATGFKYYQDCLARNK